MTDPLKSRPPRNFIAPLLIAVGLLAWTLMPAAPGINPLPDQVAEAAGEEIYQQFNRFALENFGAEKEPLVYEKFGSTLEFMPQGEWIYVSERSAVIAFETNLPAKSLVNFGPTSAYGSQTGEPERYFYLHLHYLTGLQPNTTYNYQLVARDERGSVIASENRTFTTRSTTGAIHIPDDLSGPPYILDQQGATYVVTQDLVVPGTAFEIAAPGIVLDLGGHRIIYNSQSHPGGISNPRDQAYFGVKNRRYAGVKDIKILNGILEQGAGNDAAVGSIGFNPIYISSVGGPETEIAGVTAIYSGAQVSGIFVDWPGDEPHTIHHNVTLDRGTVVLNRHGAGVRGILIYDYRGSTSVRNALVHHNLVKRSRHAGITGNVLYNNEVYIDSYDTNAYAIAPLDFREGHGYEAFNNRVFGTGYHVVGFAWGNNLHIYDNFVHLQGVEPTNRSDESGTHASVIGMRLTQYGGSTHPYEDNLYENNVIAVYGRNGTTLVRGVQFMSDPNVKNLRFRDNIVKVIVQDDSTPRVAAAVVAEGGNGCEDNPPVIYENNILISNITNVQIGDSYGNAACNHHFLANTFVADSATLHPGYVTFKYDFWSQSAPQRTTVVRDAVFQGAASLDSLHFQNDEQDFHVEWTLSVRVLDSSGAPVEGAQVSIQDRRGTLVAQGTTDPQGNFHAPLKQYVARQSGKTEYTPHSIAVSYGDWAESRQVTMDRARSEVFYTGAPTASFQDVPPNHPYFPYIEALYRAGYVKGCSEVPPLYCPDRAMNRAESAVFTVRGVHGANFMPPQPSEQVFGDVALDAWYADWVTQLWEDGYTAGCSSEPLLYCPERTHSRAEGAVFFLRMMYGADYQPPPAKGYFVDVPLEAWYARWVDAAWEAGIAEICGENPLRYCPEEPLSRAVAARMMYRAKGLSAPTVSSFDVQPRRTLDSFTITWAVSDPDGLQRINVYRAPDQGGRPDEANRSLVASITPEGTSHSGSAVDQPPAGSWWYSLQAIDLLGNPGREPDPPGPLLRTKESNPGSAQDLSPYVNAAALVYQREPDYSREECIEISRRFDLMGSAITCRQAIKENDPSDIVLAYTNSSNCSQDDALCRYLESLPHPEDYFLNFTSDSVQNIDGTEFVRRAGERVCAYGWGCSNDGKGIRWQTDYISPSSRATIIDFYANNQLPQYTDGWIFDNNDRGCAYSGRLESGSVEYGYSAPFEFSRGMPMEGYCNALKAEMEERLPQNWYFVDNTSNYQTAHCGGYGWQDCTSEWQGVQLSRSYARAFMVTRGVFQEFQYRISDTLANFEDGYGGLEEIWEAKGSPANHLYIMWWVSSAPQGIQANGERVKLFALGTHLIYQWERSFLRYDGQNANNTPLTGDWIGAMSAPIGDPLGKRYQLDEQTLRRDFENGLVIVRYRTHSSQSYADSATYDLGGLYRPLRADGSLGAPISSITLRNAEAFIGIKDG